MDGFIANLYEFFGFVNLGNFSNDMFQNGFYLSVFMVMVSTCLLASVSYYYIVNHPRGNRWYHWLFFNLGCSLLNFILAWAIVSDKMVGYYAQQQMDTPYDWTNYFVFSCIAFAWAFIGFFLFSILIKRWSSNCKHSPYRCLV